MSYCHRGEFANLMFPIMVTRKMGVIIYKNAAAMRCIRHPRCGGNISPCVDSVQSLCPRRREGYYLVSLTECGSSYRNAAVMRFSNDEYLWVFYPFMQICNAADITETDEDITAFVDSVASFFKNVGAPRRSSPDSRYIRMGEHMLRALKYMDIFNPRDRYIEVGASISLIRNVTDRLLSDFRIRHSFNVSTIAPDECSLIPFDRFAAMFIQLIYLSLRLSRNPMTEIELYCNDALFTMIISCNTDRPIPGSPYDGSMSCLAQAYPEEMINILLTEQNARSFGCQMNYRPNGDKGIFLQLSMPTEQPDLRMRDIISVTSADMSVLNAFISRLAEETIVSL